MSTFAYMLDTCRVNSCTVYAMNNSKDPRSQDSFSFGIGLVMSLVLPFIQMRPQARSQKFAMGGLFRGSWGGAPSRWRPMEVWGRSPQLPGAGGLGAKPPAAGGTGVWGLSPQRSKILHFFAKITSF